MKPPRTAPRMKHVTLALSTLALYALHQDVWLWRAVEPRLLGFLPAGLWYHAAYCAAASALLWALVRWAWPSDLERLAEREPDEPAEPPP